MYRSAKNIIETKDDMFCSLIVFCSQCYSTKPFENILPLIFEIDFL